MDNINKNANIPDIEDLLYIELSKKLDNIKVGFFPKAIEEATDSSFVLIDVANDIDYTYIPIKVGAYIWLCAKNAGDTKNSAALKKMENKLDDIVESFQDEKNIYLLRKKRSKAMYINNEAYSCNMVTLEVTIL